MTADLHDLLDRAVPEPPGRLDADRVLCAARRRVATRRATAAGGALALVAVLAGGGLALARDGGDTARYAEVPLQVSALDRTAPLGEVARGASGVERGVTVARLPGPPPTDVVLFEDEGLLCLMVVSEVYGSASVGCFERSQLLDRGVLITDSGFEVEPLYLVVVAPDGYTEARADGRRADVVGNAAVLEVDSRSARVTISGPDVPDRTFAADGTVTTPPERQRAEGDASARARLEELRQQAEQYRRANGSLAGFASSLGPAGATRRMLREVSDRRAVAEVSDGCLVLDLATGLVEAGPCP